MRRIRPWCSWPEFRELVGSIPWEMLLMFHNGLQQQPATVRLTKVVADAICVCCSERGKYLFCILSPVVGDLSRTTFTCNDRPRAGGVTSWTGNACCAEVEEILLLMALLDAFRWNFIWSRSKEILRWWNPFFKPFLLYSNYYKNCFKIFERNQSSKA